MHLGVAYSVWSKSVEYRTKFCCWNSRGTIFAKVDRTFIMEVGHKNSIQTTMTTRRISSQPLETTLFPSYSLSMASSLSSSSSFATFRCPNPRSSNSAWCRDNLSARVTITCESNGSQPPPKLEIGSPIIVVEAPKTIKTAASVPCLRVNSGLVNPGDVGRIVSRKPRDVWAVRLAIGTYLIDRKYFKPLNIAAESSDDTPELNP